MILTRDRIKGAFLMLICFLMIFAFSSCNKGESDLREREMTEDTTSAEKSSVLILGNDFGIDKALSEYIEASLLEEGIEVYREGDVSEKGEVDLVLGVGREGVLACLEIEVESPVVYCTWEGSFPDTGEYETAGIKAHLSSRDIILTSLSLLPSAESIAIISSEEGASKVQDGCDALDVMGFDYTVEALSAGQPYGDAAITAAKKGYSIVILPCFDLSAGGIDLGEEKKDTAVISVGEGEPVKGALATFCLDVQRLSMDAAKICRDILQTGEAESIEGGYYKICISESISAYFEVDTEAALDYFPLVITE